MLLPPTLPHPILHHTNPLIQPSYLLAHPRHLRLRRMHVIHRFDQNIRLLHFQRAGATTTAIAVDYVVGVVGVGIYVG